MAAVTVLIAFVLIGRPLVSAGLERREELVSTNTKVDVSRTATVLEHGDQVCASQIYVPEEATKLRVFLGTSVPGTPRLRVSVRPDGGESLRRSVRVETPNAPLDVRLGGLAADEAEVCFRNAGRVPVSLANREDSGETYQGRPGVPRIDALSDDTPRTVALLPEAIERAGLFKGGLVAPGVIVAMLLVSVGAIGFALSAVMRDTAGDHGHEEGG